MPSFDHSALGGYALRRADLVGQGLWDLPVGQRRAVGQAAAKLDCGEVARMFTGALIPEGSDAVVMKE